MTTIAIYFLFTLLFMALSTYAKTEKRGTYGSEILNSLHNHDEREAFHSLRKHDGKEAFHPLRQKQ